jgi:hypothetical protein
MGVVGLGLGGRIGMKMKRQKFGFRIADLGFRKAKKNLCDLGVSAVKHQRMVEFFFLPQRTRRDF